MSSESTTITIRRQETLERTTITVLQTSTTQASTARTSTAQTSTAQTRTAQIHILKALTSKRNSLGMKKKHRDKCPVPMSI